MISTTTLETNHDLPVRGESDLASWRFLALAQITNFSALRRHVGKARADRLSRDISARIHSLLHPANQADAARSIVEIEMLGRSISDATEALERLSKAFCDPIDVDGEQYQVQLALAAAASPIIYADDVRLIEEAEIALAQAVAERRPIVHDITIPSSSIDRLCVSRDLGDAIARNDVFIQYQPKLHVRRQQIVSAEALIRWEHPTRGLILPNDFIPLAEQVGLIGPLTLWTLNRVIADLELLRADGHHLTIFINISGQLLSDRQFIGTACDLITSAGASVGFEITETSMICDPDSAVEHLTLAASRGIPIAIDDYGAGLSSLAYLKRLPASELKIDKMFVMELTSSHRDPLIVRSTIDLAHAMEMEVTAEGVETPAALALLSVMGCDQVQGFLLSRPLSLTAFQQFMKSESAQGIGRAPVAVRQSNNFWKAA